MKKKNQIVEKTSARNKSAFFLNIGLRSEREHFVENLSMLIASGMDILSALQAVKQEIHSNRMRQIISGLEGQIKDGSSLWRSLESSRIFSAQTISLARIGEETGTLVENLKVIATQAQKERSFRSRISSALMYPAIILTLTFVIGVGIVWFILPRLAIVFAQLRLDLPLLTRALIKTGAFFSEYGSVVMPVFGLAIVAAVYFFFISAKTKFLGQGMLLKLPAVRNLIKEVEIARLGYLLGTLLKAGMPIVKALDSLEQATAFRAYKKFYNHLHACVLDGNSFKKSFAMYPRTNNLIPVSIQKMMIAGEQSGSLSKTLLYIGETFDNKTETSAKNLTVILEPILLIIVWLGVVAVALAVILPIYSLVGGLN